MRLLPNFLSSLRIVLGPVAVAVAMATGSRSAFLWIFGLAMLTDACDGFLARLLHCETDLGRKLDSWGDYTTIAAGLGGLILLWPHLIARDWPWLVAGLSGYLAVIVYGLIRWGSVPGYHTWASKALGVAMFVTMPFWLAEWAAWPFLAVTLLQALGGVEELAIAWILPGFSGEMPTVWHALRHRRALGGQQEAAGARGTVPRTEVLKR